MKVVISLFSASVAGKVFPRTGENPGCGGTQHVSVMLARRLAEARPDWDIHLANDAAFEIDARPENLSIETVASVEELCEKAADEQREQAPKLIVPGALLERLPQKLLAAISDRTVCWIHHPFWLRPKLKRASFAAYACVGVYQWHSNSGYYPRIWHIQNVFEPRYAAQSRGRPEFVGHGAFRLIYLGALVEGKGFHHVARQWRRLKDTIPGVRLEVVGSSSTYGGQPEHPLVPCDYTYAEEILGSIGERDIKEGRVVFHGNLGSEKAGVIAGCAVAVQNPTGSSEAFPASPLECMALGVPVVASGDYGMGDAMRFFPETVLRTPEEIPQRVEALTHDSLLRMELRERGLAVAKLFELRSGEALCRWQQLLETIANGRVETRRAPSMPFWGSRSTLVRRAYDARLRNVVEAVKGRVPG